MFSACVGLRELESEELAVEITGDSDPFPGARTKELDMTSVLGALILAFRRWQHVHG